MRIRTELALMIVVGVALQGTAQVPMRPTAPQNDTSASTRTQQKAAPGSNTKKKGKKGKPPAAKVEPEQPPPPPPPPPTPEQMPATAPQVSYQNGQLTIQSRNSTLTDILTAVRRQTGAQMDVPPAAAGQRIATRLGPGSPREVLTALLSGSKFDYVILGSAQNPNAVQRLILTLRTGGPSQGPAPTVAQTAPMGGAAASEPEPGSEPEEEEPVAEEPAPEPAQPEAQPQPGADNGQQVTEPNQGPGQPIQPQPGQPIQPQPGPGQPVQPQANEGGEQQEGQPQVKTPEQLLQELQRMQQQQQQQQQQNPPN